jgi:hypothetical protein
VPETWRLFHRHASSQWSDRGYLARQGKPASSELVDLEALRREFARTPPLIRCLSAVGPYPKAQHVVVSGKAASILRHLASRHPQSQVFLEVKPKRPTVGKAVLVKF